MYETNEVMLLECYKGRALVYTSKEVFSSNFKWVENYKEKDSNICFPLRFQTSNFIIFDMNKQIYHNHSK